MAINDERRASAEIIGYSYKLFLCQIPMLPFIWRRRLYKSYVVNLSKTSFNMYGGQVVEALCFQKHNSCRFYNTDRELGDVLEWLPRLLKYRSILRKRIEKQRIKYHLKV